jgi:hypothetical protein
MGQVSLAEDIPLERKVALKFPPSHFLALAEKSAVSTRESAGLASLISICLLMGWACTFLGQRESLGSRRGSHL